MKVLAFRSVEIMFKIPKGVKLMTWKESKAAPENTPFSWWIKWDVLHYIDADGNHQIIEEYDQLSDDKFPNGTEFQDDSDDEESESEEEEKKPEIKFTGVRRKRIIK